MGEPDTAGHAHLHPHEHHAHEFQALRETSRSRLLLVLGLTSVFLIVEVAGALLTGSLALLADAGHMLTDVAALALALFAMWFSARPATPQRTYGYHRAEILAALANGLLLVGIVIYILWEAFQRLQNPPEIDSFPMLLVAAAGLLVNLAGAWILTQSTERSLNVQGAYLHVLGDALGSIGVLVAAGIMLLTGWYLADPIISVVIGLVILYSGWDLIRQTTDVLLEAVPSHIDLEEVRAEMLSIQGVESVHDLHIWTLTSGFVSLSAHVVVEDVSRDGQRVLMALRDTLLHRFGIGHTTIQIEGRDYPDEVVHCVGDPRCLP